MSEDTQHTRMKPRRENITQEEWREVIEDRLDHGSAHMKQMQESITSLQGVMLENTKLTVENTALTLANAQMQKESKAITDEIYKFLLTGKTIWSVFSIIGGFLSKLLKLLAVLAKWATVIVTGGLAIYSAWYAYRHNGALPADTALSKTIRGISGQ